LQVFIYHEYQDFGSLASFVAQYEVSKPLWGSYYRDNFNETPMPVFVAHKIYSKKKNYEPGKEGNYKRLAEIIKDGIIKDGKKPKTKRGGTKRLKSKRIYKSRIIKHRKSNLKSRRKQRRTRRL
jgi:hypothetical protein